MSVDTIGERPAMPPPIEIPRSVVGTPYDGLAGMILEESRRRDYIEELRRGEEDRRRVVYERERQAFSLALESHAALIAQLRELLESQTARFSELTTRFSALTARFSGVELDLKAIRAQVVEIGTRMGVLTSSVDRQDDELGQLRVRMSAVEAKVEAIKVDIRRLLRDDATNPPATTVDSSEPGGEG